MRHYLVYITNMLLSSAPLSSTTHWTQTWCHCQAGYYFHTCPSWLLQRHPCCGSPDVHSTLAPLQWFLHVATHTVLNLKPRDHVSALRELHCLPVTARIQCKLCLLLHNSLVSHSPQYLSQLLTPVSDIPLRSALQSARNSDFDISLSRWKIGERAFCIAALLEYSVHSWL